MQLIKEGWWHGQHDRAADVAKGSDVHHVSQVVRQSTCSDKVTAADDRFGVPAYAGVGPGHLAARAAPSKRSTNPTRYRKFPVCPNEYRPGCGHTVKPCGSRPTLIFSTAPLAVSKRYTTLS